RARQCRLDQPSTPSEPAHQDEWAIGQTPDHSVVSHDGKISYHDRFRASSPLFLGWTFFKFLIGLLIAGALADNTALRFLTIQNYLVKINSSWLAQLSKYFGILATRLSGTYVLSP